MFAVIVNVITVLIGSTVGLLCKKGIPKRLSDAVMLGIGMCTLYIGVSGTLKGENTIVIKKPFNVISCVENMFLLGNFGVKVLGDTVTVDCAKNN